MNFQNLISSVANGTVYDIDGVKLVQLCDCFSEDELYEFNQLYSLSPPEHVVTAYTMNKKDWPFDIDKSSQEYIKLLETVNTKLGTCFDHYVGRFWQEEAEHHMDKHVDNDMVCGSMQIYLPSTAAENTGTMFFGENLTVQFKFKPNTGYLCSDPTKIYHSTGVAVKNGEYRRSAYFIFRNV